jgi:lipopolysaccharide export system protein LptA
MIAARARAVRGKGGVLVAALLLATVPAGAGALAQTPPQNSDLPIEITADSLEVLQNQKIATFTGNVDAVQGDMVLSADRLRVYYDGDEQNAAPGPAGTGSIRRIEADGNVLMSSPRETAQGEAGVYDVAANQVTLDGAVVLTRGDNVIRGQRLEVDLASGRSRVFAAVPSTEGGTPPQRVRALFTPEKSAQSGAGPTGQPATTAEAGAK